LTGMFCLTDERKNIMDPRRERIVVRALICSVENLNYQM